MANPRTARPLHDTELELKNRPRKTIDKNRSIPGRFIPFPCGQWGVAVSSAL